MRKMSGLLSVLLALAMLLAGSLVALGSPFAEIEPAELRLVYQGCPSAGQKLVRYVDTMVRFPDRQLDRSVRLDGEAFDCNTLNHLLRAFPFARRERIEVPAGTFDSYRLEMGVAGLIGLFAERYKYYFWYTAAEPHYLLQYQDRDGGAVTELLEVGQGEKLP
ncbi:MAG: hypothetical protein QME79_10240 [Bacillota bacterium]|nr:hypothetical protein [Bacillota bacterium]